MKATPEMYEKAAKYMTENGMYKGDFVDPKGGRAVCLYGACYLGNELERVEKFSKYEMTLTNFSLYNFEELREVVAEETDGLHSCADVFNDAEETTQEDALLVLKKAAEKAREREGSTYNNGD